VKRPTSLCLAGLSCIVAVSLFQVPRLAAGAPQVQPTGAPGDASQPRAVLDKYCMGCHNATSRMGGLSLDGLDLAAVDQNGAILEKVARKLDRGEMPPSGRPRPDQVVSREIASSLTHALDAAAAAHPTPGRPALHRLNRTEYANAIRDLLGLEINAVELLPPDDSTHGFDNIADVLGVSPELLESYVVAGRKISQLALGNPAITPVAVVYRTAADANQDGHLEGLPFGTRGGLAVRHVFPVDGEYEFKIRLSHGLLDQVRGLQEPHDVELALDDARVRLFSLDGGAHMYEERFYNAETPSLDADKALRLRMGVNAGTRSIVATFPVKSSALDEDMLKARTFGPSFGLKGLPQIEGLTITGPYAAVRPDVAPGRRILTCRPSSLGDERSCATTILSAFARRAYRGQVTDDDLQRVLAFYDEGRKTGGFDAGIEMAVWRVLASPQFIFRFESDPATVAPGAAYRVSDLELASRLSFFLWSSIPDDQLLTVAARGDLNNPVVLEREVRRMLADPRSTALVQNFARQWLSLQKLQNIRPDAARFPDFDDNLRQAMSRETELLFEYIMRENRSVLELLTADYTFVNERLARHYGIPNVLGSRFRKVPVPDEDRRGLLGQGSVLTVTSFPTRTSPVVRGKWVLETLMGSPPPPPPPNIPALDVDGKDSSGTVLSIRDQMAKHRANPVCANCHSRMDPLGFALEPFDAVGSARAEQIDASGTLPDGTPFDGPAGLRAALLRRPEIFVGTVAEKLFTYALGRGLEYYDAPAIRAVTRDAAHNDYAFASLILGVANSVPFQMRTAPAAETPASSVALPVRTPVAGR
jgi:mono/diheme cytochrome c family protein